MENIILMTKNVFASGTVQVPGELVAYPQERIYDGDIHDLWKHNATLTFSISTQLTASTSVDFLAIHSHNFWSVGGVSISWQYYTTSWQTALTWSQTSSSTIIKTLDTPVTGTRFRVSVNTTIANPQCAEIFMSRKVFNKHPFQPWPVPFKITNQFVDYTRTGHRWALKNGDTRWACKYNFTLDDTEMAVWEQCLTDIDDGFKPFYMYDHKGTLRYVELMGPPEMPYEIPNATGIDGHQRFEMVVQEVL